MYSGIILLVEDNAGVRTILKTGLELNGYSVQTAINGKIGIETLQREKDYNLILLDLMMPVMNGREFLVEVNKHNNLKDIPIIVMTASPDMAAPQNTKDILEKPFILKDVLQKVEKWCLPRTETSL